MKEQYSKLGRSTNFSKTELKMLKVNTVPNTIEAALAETNREMFPNIYYLLCVLGILPMTTCEAEQCISTLRRLKTYMRNNQCRNANWIGFNEYSQRHRYRY